MNDRALRARLAQAGQEYLADHLDTLEDHAREHLVNQLEALDHELMENLRRRHGLAEPHDGQLAPVPYVPVGQRGPDTEAATAGTLALRAGKVAYALMAGGQASRLDLDGPKGAYEIGPKTDRSLFQILTERVRRAEVDYGVLPPLAVTTSTSTDAAIRAFFEMADCFGFDRARLAFACQASIPVLDDEGKLILASPDRIFRSPDGHGGAITALETTGILNNWKSRGIEVVCTFQVDNPLLPVVDPDFIGRLLLGDAPIATKVVLKRDPAEKVGIVASVGGKPALVEYSEITDEQAAARDGDGQLLYRLGSIAVHAFVLSFLQRELAASLPLHAARKRIPVVDADGNVSHCDGTKFERFLFDLFPRAKGVTAVEALREREFAPLKNAEGPNSPETVRAALEAEYRRWYEEAGVEPPEGPLEISPLDAIGPGDL